MNQRLILAMISVVIAQTTITGCSSSEKTQLAPTTDSMFQVGQVWRYKTHPGEEDSTLIILKIEPSRFGNIVHINVNGLNISDPGIEGGMRDTIPHLPFSKNALETSVVELIDEGVDLPSFEWAYNTWRSDEGGVFYNISI